PRPPRSPLFPYTTLFRSERSPHTARLDPAAVGKHPAAAGSPRGRRADPGGGRLPAISGPRGGARPSAVVGPRSHRHVLRRHAALDRKSTRLNSSHRTISY